MSGLDFDSAAPLRASFFERPAATVARELLGCILVSRIGGVLTAGMIVEAEAYLGADDAGSHAATKGITPRNRVMYGPPAHAYVYFTYGNHHMLNLVSEPEGVAGGVLIRAIEPITGIAAMSERRAGRSGVELTNGPGKVASALGVDLTCNGMPLGGQLAVYAGRPVPDALVATSGRIGLSAGHELPLRFYVRDNAYVSKARPGLRSPKRATRTHERKTT
ncbi:MAG: DNA-3-methyladenine glycosylase [Coriobacteriia bacterium]|nr:DNA-3-methyladenine glycosylase [Coriobacteriia bacterium]